MIHGFVNLFPLMRLPSEVRLGELKKDNLNLTRNCLHSSSSLLYEHPSDAVERVKCDLSSVTCRV